MKIYIKNKNFIPDVTRLSSCLKKIKNTTFFYTEEGIFQLNNESLDLVEYHDIMLENDSISSVDLYIDKSFATKSENFYQIPVPNICINEEKVSYRVSKVCSLEFIIIYENSLMKDFYFETNLDISTVKEQLSSFFRLLKLY